MARIRDIRPVLLRVGVLGFVRRVWQQCREDNVFTWASALAYSWLFAIFPFFLFLLSLVPYMPIDAKNWLQTNLESVLLSALPTDAYKTVWGFLTKDGRLETLLNSHPTGFLSFGLILTVWSASGGMAMTIKAMDKCYDLDEGRPFYRVRLVAVLMTVFVASLLLIAVIALPISTALRKYAQNYMVAMGIHLPEWGLFLFELSRYVIALTCMFLAVGIIYFFGPGVRQRFRVMTPGAVFTVFVWLLLGALFRVYVNTLGKGKYEQTYGPAGGVVILLLNFYLDAVVLLIGAEINSEIDFIAYNVKPGCRDFRGKPWQDEKLLATIEQPSTG